MKNKLFSIFLAAVFGILICLTTVVSAEDKASMPSTIIHHVTLKWKDGVSDADKEKALSGLKEIAMSTQGVKNIWMKSIKVQPKEYSQTFVIEFENDAALKAYAAHPKKKEWDDFYYSIRETSYNSVTSN